MSCVIKALYSVKRAPYTARRAQFGWTMLKKNIYTKKRDSHVPDLCYSVHTLAKNVYNVSAFVFLLTICRSKERRIDYGECGLLWDTTKEKHKIFCVGALLARVNKDKHRCVGPCGISLFFKYYNFIWNNITLVWILKESYPTLYPCIKRALHHTCHVYQKNPISLVCMSIYQKGLYIPPLYLLISLASNTCCCKHDVSTDP